MSHTENLFQLLVLLWLLLSGWWQTRQLKRVKSILGNTMRVVLNDGETLDDLEKRTIRLESELGIGGRK